MRWPLVLAGDGPLSEDVRTEAACSQIEGVQFPGFVDGQRHKGLIARAKWVVAPSHDNEDFGLTPIEARHVGVPCIVTRDGGLLEAPGVEALVCQPGDVDGLAAQIRRAAAMDEEEYRGRSKRTRAELAEYLQPPSVYADQYRSSLRAHGGSRSRSRRRSRRRA